LYGDCVWERGELTQLAYREGDSAAVVGIYNHADGCELGPCRAISTARGVAEHEQAREREMKLERLS
jgi:hypothetical protein